MFTGLMAALVTPMKADGEVDFPAFERLIQFQLQHKTDAIVVLGTTGESSTITELERDQLVRCAVASVAGQVPVIIGAGTNNTETTISLVRHAAECGADAALLVTPYYSRPPQAGLLAHFRRIAQCTDFPLILYNVPKRCGIDLADASLLALQDFKNIVAYKDATGDPSRVTRLRQAGFRLPILSGDDGSALAAMVAGADGLISVAANVVPGQLRQLVDAVQGGRLAEAETIDQTLSPLYAQLGVMANPIPVKWVLQQMGFISSGIRLPLVDLAHEYHEPMTRVLDLLGLLVDVPQ